MSKRRKTAGAVEVLVEMLYRLKCHRRKNYLIHFTIRCGWGVMVLLEFLAACGRGIESLIMGKCFRFRHTPEPTEVYCDTGC